MTCQYVTERAIEGPCAVIVYTGWLEGPSDSIGELPCNIEDDDHRTGGNHKWLGPVLARCDYREDEHPPATAHRGLVILDHAFMDVT